jgi:membrane-bound lytic murein transglycosylase D
MRVAAILFLAISMQCFGQSPEVPHKIQFAGITLTIRDDARREIQKDVDAFTQSPRHFNIKVERAKTYFPIIEKIFAEERVPDDFKYLVIQESALIADAVSTSNAVGFWQFKDFTAIEMGLRVDKEIDERMNIAAASRAAAKYIKKNNFYFNNWVYALQAYQMGAGGVMQKEKDYQSGTKHMEITSRTYWYVKKFLAHKIAYENAIKGPAQTHVLTIENTSRKSLAELAKEFALDETELKEYNKWVRKEIIPGDRAYTVLIPNAGDNPAIARALEKTKEKPITEKQKETPKRIEAKPAVAKSNRIFHLGLPAIQAEAGETVVSLAKRAEVDLSYFLRCNDMTITDRIQEGTFYFVARKRAHASSPQHVSKPGDNIWLISQLYGVQLKKLRKYNKGITTGALPEGTVVLLTNRKNPATLFKADEPVVEVDTRDAFAWSLRSDDTKMASILPVVTNDIQQTEAASQPISVGNEPLTTGQHRVASGETLYSIAKRYNAKVMDLVEWNSLNLTDGLRIGQVLKISNAEAGTAQKQDTEPASIITETVHEVKSSETLYSVARKYGVTIKELMDWNQKTDFNLVPGEKLRVLLKP